MSRGRRKCNREQRLEHLEDRCLLSVFPPGFTAESSVSGFDTAVDFDWAPDGRMFVGEKAGVVKVVEDGAVNATPFIDISDEVNNAHDRGMLGIAVHPEFPAEPYVYMLYTYDPPGAAPNALHSRVSRLVRVSADASTNYSTALAGSEIVLLGTNSTLANIPQPNVRNPANPACGPEGSYVRDCIPADEISHTIGTVMFAPDGSLFVGSGDGGNFTTAQDYNVRAVNLDSLAGKLLRIHPLTGEAYPDNPFFDGDFGSNASKVYSYGLRNPFRFTIHPDTGEPYIGDVGWGAWEEINRGEGVNFGWPCYEGGNGTSNIQNGYSSFATCQALVSSGGVTPSIYAYPHSGSSASIGAGAFYQGEVYPAEYRDALFIFDFSRQTVFIMSFDMAGDVDQVTTFATSAGGIVKMAAGPDTNIYYADVFTGQINRLRYTAGGNTPPTAVIEVEQSASNTFDFFGSLSFDPDAEPLTYLWDFGDGQTSILANPTHDYVLEGAYSVSLTVTDPNLATGTVNQSVTAGNLPPIITVQSPIVGATYQIGDVITLAATATDVEDGQLTGSSIEWDVFLHHAGHVHLDFFQGEGESTSFVADDHEDNSYYEVCASANDSLGEETTVCVDLQPQLVTYTFNSVPSGLQLNYSGQDLVTPFALDLPIGSIRTISANDPQGGWSFVSWSDGGTETHDFPVGASSSELLATYSNPSFQGSAIAVRAGGDTGEELIDLQLDQISVATYSLSTNMTDFFYVHDSVVEPGSVRVEFLNNVSVPIDRNATIDRIVIDGTTYETEHASTFGTGTHQNGSCSGTYAMSQRLHCDGYFQFADSTPIGSTVVIRATSDVGLERIELQVDQVVVATYDLTADLEDYVYVHDSVIVPGQIRVAFVNNGLSNLGEDLNVTVDYVILDGTQYEMEDPSVLSTGTWTNGSCAAGFKQSARLHCNGYFQLADPALGSTILVRAAGDTGDEIIELQIDGIAVSFFDLTTSMSDYFFTHNSTVDISQVRVAFVNDLFAPPIDRNVTIDRVNLDGQIFESEAPSVLSTGTYTGNCNPGFKLSQRLHCNGYFEYGAGAIAASSSGEEGEPASFLNSNTLYVYGTLGNDVVEFTYGASSHIDINGVIVPIADSVQEVVIYTDGGRDRVSLVGSKQNDRLVVKPISLKFHLPNLLVTVVDANDLEVLGNRGTGDRAIVYDSPGNDRFVLRPSQLSVTGAMSSQRLRGFEAISVLATSGGFDRAIVKDSGARDHVRVDSQSLRISARHYANVVRYFERQQVRLRGGGDSVTIIGDSGAESLIGTGSRAVHDSMFSRSVFDRFDRLTWRDKDADDFLDIDALDSIFSEI